jgi:hydrogenase/urease accessory protein HupE
MTRWLFLVLAIFGMLGGARAHDPKLSSVTIRREGDRIRIAVVVPEARAEGALGRVKLLTDGKPARPTPDAVTPDQVAKTALIDAHFDGVRQRAALALENRLFPEDPQSKTLVFVYDGAKLSAEAVLDAANPTFDTSRFFDREPSGIALAWRFLREGVAHIFGGPDHVLFVIGLLLLGGTVKRLLKVVTAFTLAHSITLFLAATGTFTLPPALVEPVIALSIVAVGVESLLAKPGGYDGRLLMAFGFGLIHGFGFAGALAEIGLPKTSLPIALAAFNGGVELGQLAIVLTVAPALGLLAHRYPKAGRRAVIGGAVAVILMGAVWFLQRIA